MVFGAGGVGFRGRSALWLFSSIAVGAALSACGATLPADEALTTTTSVEPTTTSESIATTVTSSTGATATLPVPVSAAGPLGPPESVEPMLVEFPGFQHGLNVMFGDPAGAGVWFTQFTRDTGYELVHLVSVDPLVVERWPLELGDSAYGADVGAVHGSTVVLYAQPRRIIRFDTVSGSVIDQFDVPNPAPTSESPDFEPPDVQASPRVIQAVALDPFGATLAVVSGSASVVQYVSMVDPAAPPVEVAVPADTSPSAVVWGADGTSAIGLLNYEGRVGSGNLLIVDPQRTARLVDVIAEHVTWVGESFVTSPMASVDFSIVDAAGTVRPLKLLNPGDGLVGYGQALTAQALALSLRGGLIGVFDWTGAYRQTVTIPPLSNEYCDRLRDGSLSSTTAPSAPGPSQREAARAAGQCTRQGGSMVADGAGAIWFAAGPSAIGTVVPLAQR